MTLVSLDRSKGEKHKYPTPGLCIYCGRTDLPLEDEHIVPFGFAGDGIIFEDASCRPCASFINKEFETHCIGSMFLPFRLRAGAPTRNKKKRPTKLELKIMRFDADDKPFEAMRLMVPVEQMPLSIMGWTFPRPGILAGRAPSDEIVGEAWSGMKREDYEPFVTEYRRVSGYTGEVAVSCGRMEEKKFFRFLAKTAHAFAVANEGYGTFTPLVLDLILGKSQHYCHYIGSGDEHDPNPIDVGETFRLLHGHIRRPEATYLAVLVQPASFWGSPKYMVIVGKRERAQDQVPFSQETPHAP